MRRMTIVTILAGRQVLDDVELDVWEQALGPVPSDVFSDIIRVHFRLTTDPISIDEVLEEWQRREDRDTPAAPAVVVLMDSRRSASPLDALHDEAALVACPSCAQPVGQRCVNPHTKKPPRIPHPARSKASDAVSAAARVAS